MKKATLSFNNIRLSPSQTHKFRGYVGNIFSEYDLIHNHDPVSGKPIYRYPLIQFKIINGTPCIIALTENAVQIFTEIFMGMDEMIIGEKRIPVHEKDLKIETVEFGFSKETFMYEFITPWIGLNQNNHKTYIGLDTQNKKNDLLKRILIGNILSMSKNMDVYLSAHQKIITQLQLKQTKVILKGKPMVGFKGMFKTNFQIPDNLGLGKSVSRGLGTVRRLI